MAQIAALVPNPKVNLTRICGVFAPSSKYCALVTPVKRDKGNKREENRKINLNFHGSPSGLFTDPPIF